MKIDHGGTPIFVSPRRHDGGVILHQGTGRIRMTRPEALAVLEAMRSLMMPEGAETMTDIEDAAALA